MLLRGNWLVIALVYHPPRRPSCVVAGMYLLGGTGTRRDLLLSGSLVLSEERLRFSGFWGWVGKQSLRLETEVLVRHEAKEVGTQRSTWIGSCR